MLALFLPYRYCLRSRLSSKSHLLFHGKQTALATSGKVFPTAQHPGHMMRIFGLWGWTSETNLGSRTDSQQILWGSTPPCCSLILSDNDFIFSNTWRIVRRLQLKQQTKDWLMVLWGRSAQNRECTNVEVPSQYWHGILRIGIDSDWLVRWSLSKLSVIPLYLGGKTFSKSLLAYQKLIETFVGRFSCSCWWVSLQPTMGGCNRCRNPNQTLLHED